jgi:hypothetical protein
LEERRGTVSGQYRHTADRIKTCRVSGKPSCFITALKIGVLNPLGTNKTMKQIQTTRMAACTKDRMFITKIRDREYTGCGDRAQRAIILSKPIRGAG